MRALHTNSTMARLGYCLSLILCIVVNFNPNICNAQRKQDQRRKLLFVFGDSLFDPGNNQYLKGGEKSAATSYPYGISLHNHPTGRLSDGLLVPDYLALLADLDVPPPFLKPGADFSDGANFASAGSGVLEIHPGVMNLKIQLSNFKKMVASLVKQWDENETKNVLMCSVYLFSTGGNDYMSFSSENPNSTSAEKISYRSMVLGNLTLALTELYEIGARKFAFQNVGPLGCLPMTRQSQLIRNDDCAESFLSMAKLHNEALPSALNNLEKNLAGFNYSIFDYFNSLLDRIDHPKNYGFKVGKIACCGTGKYNGENCGGGDNGTAYNLCKNPSEYVFFDGGHTTQNTNHQLAELIWSGTPIVTGPYNMNQLFQID